VGLPVKLSVFRLVTEFDYSFEKVKNFGAKLSLNF
jgi:hypothetical protein